MLSSSALLQQFHSRISIYRAGIQGVGWLCSVAARLELAARLGAGCVRDASAWMCCARGVGLRCARGVALRAAAAAACLCCAREHVRAAVLLLLAYVARAGLMRCAMVLAGLIRLRAPGADALGLVACCCVARGWS